MARRRKGQWQRNENAPWYTTIGRETIRVANAGDSFATAFKRMAELLADAGDVPAVRIFGL